MPSKAPESIGRYQVVKELKSGGMGTVFLGRDPRIGRHMGGRFVAIKVLQEFEDQELRARFDREADIAGTLDHRNIVQIYDNGEFEGRPFIVMEYVDGQTMREAIESRDVPLVRRLEWMEALCDGLACAHRAGVVHRDIKPDNVIIRTQDGVLKILDFGIARSNTIKANMTRGLLGTLNYMAPEQWEATASVDSRADQFAAGAVFYELLTGRKAFPGGDVPSIYRQISMLAPEPLDKRQPNLDPELIAVVNRCLEKQPGDRFPDMDAVRGELAAIRQRLASRDAAVTIVRPARTFINEAQRALETGEFEAALKACAKALESEPANTVAREIEGRARAAIKIQGWIYGAREAFGRGSLTEASQLVDQVLALDDKHPEGLSIRQEIDTARFHVEREVQIDAARARAREALDQDQLDAARTALAELVELDRGNADLPSLNARLGAALARRRAAEEDARARQAAASARAQFAAGQHEAALALLEGHHPPHAAVTAALGELRAEHQEIERRRVGDQRARRTIEEAERRAKAGDRAGALSFLESHQPPHPEVKAAVVALRGQIEEIERQRADAEARRSEQERERKRIEAERAAKAAEEQRRRVESERAAKAADEERRRIEKERAAKAADEERRRIENERAAKAADEERRRIENERRKKAEEEQRRQAEEEKRRQQERDRLRVQPQPRPQQDLERTIVIPPVPAPAPAPAPKAFDWRLPAAAAGIVIAIGVGAYFTFGRGGSETPSGGQAVVEPPKSGGEPAPRPAAATPPAPTPEPPASAVNTPPATPSATTPPATEPVAAPSSAALDRQVAGFLSTAQQRWKGNDRPGAMASLASASKLKPGDQEILRVGRGFMKEMSERASTAARQALSAGAADAPKSPFAEGRLRQQDGGQFEKSGKADESVRAYGEAVDLFNRARTAAETAAATRGTPPPSPPITVTPPASTTAAGRSTPPPTAPEPLTPPPAPPTPAPTPAATTPAAVNPPAAAAVVVNETEAVRATIQKYRAAFESLNPAAVKAVRPGLDGRSLRGLEDTFRQYTSLKYDIQITRVDLAADGKSASVPAVVTSIPIVRTGNPPVTKSNALFTLQKNGDTWTVKDVNFKN